VAVDGRRTGFTSRQSRRFVGESIIASFAWRWLLILLQFAFVSKQARKQISLHAE